jgi:DNA repair protein RadC
MTTTNTKLYTLKKIDTDFPKVKITSSFEGQKFIRQFYGDDIEVYESVFILLLNRAMVTIGYAKISQGGIVASIVDKKILAKYVLDSLANSVILAHNHPSGQLRPSDSDMKLTREVKELFNIIDTKLMDHIILTKDHHFSLADEGLL